MDVINVWGGRENLVKILIRAKILIVCIYCLKIFHFMVFLLGLLKNLYFYIL